MALKINELKEQITKALNDPTKPWAPVFKTIEDKTGLNRLYIFVGTVAIIALWLVFGFAAQLVCNIVGFIYPAYVSIHAIESRNKDDDTKWLTYWVVFAIFSIVEFFADFIVGWFPLYWLIKCTFFVWLMIPTDLNGSIILYKKVVRPYFLKHSSQIDKTLDAVGDKVKDIVNKQE